MVNPVPLPARKGTSEQNDSLAKPDMNTGGVTKAAYIRKPAAPFSNPNVAPVRKPSGVSPQGVPTNDADAGNSQYSHRGANKKVPSPQNGAD